MHPGGQLSHYNSVRTPISTSKTRVNPVPHSSLDNPLIASSISHDPSGYQAQPRQNFPYPVGIPHPQSNKPLRLHGRTLAFSLYIWIVFTFTLLVTITGLIIALYVRNKALELRVSKVEEFIGFHDPRLNLVKTVEGGLHEASEHSNRSPAMK
ncbi:unnamed protein product, partial [Dicrocoelium dendriticum]